MEEDSNLEEDRFHEEPVRGRRERQRRQNSAAQRAHRERMTRPREEDLDRNVEMEEVAQETIAHRRELALRRQRQHRLRASSSETEQRQQQDLVAHRIRRARASSSEVEQRQQQDTIAHRIRRSRASSSEVEQRQQQNTIAHRIRRARASSSEVQQRQRQDAEAHRIQRRNPRRATHLIAATSAVPEEHYQGPMSETCSNCGAKFFKGEATKKGGTFNPCCNHGKVRLPLFVNYPELLKNLFTGLHRCSANFLERSFNNSLAVASMNCKLEKIPGRGPYHFRVHGHVYHFVGPAVPEEGQQPSYGQLYIMDTAQAASERLGNKYNVDCDSILMQQLSAFMSRHHPYARSYKMLCEIYEEEKRRAGREQRSAMDIRMYFHVDPKMDKRRYNVPTANEVAVVYVGPDGDLPAPRTYSIEPRTGGLTKVPLISKELDPMLYPVFFLRNDEGWHPDIMKQNTRGLSNSNKRVSQKEYYSYLLSVRNTFNPLHYARKLFQQFVVDSWAKVDQNRLNYIRTHQKELRAEKYQILHDFINDGEEGIAGARIILPATHTNSPRYMKQCYQDAMTIVTRCGKPTYFITFTCNPRWKEIQENLLPGQTAADRPDIVARVFNLKLGELMDDITRKHVFGKPIAFIYVIEWQKRGLPHAHILLTMASQDEPDTVEKINKLVCAELPDLSEEGNDQELWDLVVANMIHKNCGPGAPCWDGEKCSKRFPKPFSDETVVTEHGYPTYKRRDNGIHVTMDGKTYTNAHVVPFCIWLIKKYKGHLNFEICCYIDACKYLYKYCYKGSDKATIKLTQDQGQAHGGVVDEIEEHLDARYVCAPEAIHRLFGFILQNKSHSVIHLMVHLPDFQTVTFEVEHEEDALQRAGHTTLLGYFKLNSDWNGEGEIDPKTLFYYQIPEHFTWNKKDGVWNPQRRKTNNLGRIHSVSPKEKERATSYHDLFTINGHHFDSAEETARALGLIDNEDHFERAMAEAATFHMPSGLRCMFVALMGFEGTTAAAAQWELHKNHMSEDYLHRGALARFTNDPNRRQEAERIAQSLAYFDIMDMCNLANIPWDKIVEPPTTQRPDVLDAVAMEDHKRKGQEMYSSLNEEQKTVADYVLEGGQKLVFVDGPGGSGKTFVYECVYNILKGRGTKVLCCAWTGIAGNLLPDGRTIASLFKLSIEEDCRRSTMSPNSAEGSVLKSIEVFIIDECSMLAYWMLDTINILLQDIHDGDLPKEQRRLFGGRSVFLGGDFRQVLPIPSKVSGVTPSQACLKHSSLFSQCRAFQLTHNVRAATESLGWKNFLLEIGDGRAEADENGRILLPEEIISKDNIIDEIFEGKFDQAEILANRAILCPKNKDVDNINIEILQRMSGLERVFLSCDSVGRDSQEDALILPTEFLNSLSPSGLPPHRLELKKGCVVILLRNLCVKKGLCNGTRLQVTDLSTSNVVNCRFINGPRNGEIVHIPRIELISKQGLGFELRRRQFPLRLAFAMTINKSQGQSLEKVGVDLTEEVFSHGQLYVALSRCKTKSGVKVRTSAIRDRTKNVVDTSVF